MGYGEKANLAWDVVARNAEISPKAVAMLEFTPRDSLDESKLPPGSRMNVPVIFVYHDAPLLDVSTSGEVSKALATVSSVKDFVEKCKGRNQLAKMVIISDPQKKDDKSAGRTDWEKLTERLRAAQLSLEAAEGFISNVVEQKTSNIKR